ncbi:MAG: transposase family protein [Rhodopirellula sp.]|nr:transposase family protein [Rhodopirellula sp.]
MQTGDSNSGIAPRRAICGGAGDLVAIAEFERSKQKWPAKFLDPTNGIPSSDRLNQVLAAAIRSSEFEKCLLSWISAWHEMTQGRL